MSADAFSQKIQPGVTGLYMSEGGGRSRGPRFCESGSIDYFTFYEDNNLIASL